MINDIIVMSDADWVVVAIKNATGRVRTSDLMIFSHTLSQLSYSGLYMYRLHTT